MTMGQRIQRLRKQKGLSQEELAAQIGVARQTISKWELDQSTPDIPLLSKLSDLFRVSTDHLIKGEPFSCSSAAPSSPTENRSWWSPQHLVGILLLAFAIICLLYLVIGPRIWMLGIVSEFLLLACSLFTMCGVVCLVAKQRTPLWCAWICFPHLSSALYLLPFALSLDSVDFLLLFDGFLLVLLCILIWWSVRVFRQKPFTPHKKHWITLVVAWCIYGCSLAAESLMLYHQAIRYHSFQLPSTMWLEFPFGHIHLLRRLLLAFAIAFTILCIKNRHKK